MTPILRVGLIILVVMGVGVAWVYWPSHADPKSSDMHERLTAVTELVGSSGSASLDTLGDLAGDAELRVALAAVRAIGSRRDEASRLKLKHIATKNKNGVLRGTAAAELGRFEKTDYRLLTGILLNDESPKARSGAARGLKRLHNSAALGALVKALTDPDPDTRRNVYEAIGSATAIRFRFDASAEPETQAENIAGIKRRLASIKRDMHPD
ncbi:MAG: HEAT repeat domain-containing protein [Phycisphaerae bacterium]|jgi:hypothetical protein|nr:HEAT repeat domain-containing protein [Phycisphaerae bacterium]